MINDEKLLSLQKEKDFIIYLNQHLEYLRDTFSDGSTILHIAVEKGFPVLVYFIMSRHSDPAMWYRAERVFMRTPAAIAGALGNEMICTIMLHYYSIHESAYELARLAKNELINYLGCGVFSEKMQSIQDSLSNIALLKEQLENQVKSYLNDTSLWKQMLMLIGAQSAPSLAVPQERQPLITQQEKEQCVSLLNKWQEPEESKQNILSRLHLSRECVEKTASTTTQSLSCSSSSTTVALETDPRLFIGTTKQKPGINKKDQSQHTYCNCTSKK